MPNPGDFDPAKAVQGARQQRAAEEAKKRAAEEAKKQREEAEKQRRQAQEDLRRANLLKLLRYADEQLEDIRNPIISEFVVTERWWKEHFFGGTRQHQRQTRYYGSWLSLSSTSGYRRSKRGLVKLCQPRAGYAYVDTGGEDPRNVSNITIFLTDIHGHKRPDRSDEFFRVSASLEEAIEDGIPNLFG